MNDILGNGRLHRNLEAGALITGLCRLMPVRAALSHWVAGWSEAAENEEWKCWSLSGADPSCGRMQDPGRETSPPRLGGQEASSTSSLAARRVEW